MIKQYKHHICTSIMWTTVLGLGLTILLFFSAQIFHQFCFLLYPFCFSSSHVEQINGVQYLERSTWHFGCTLHWNAISGPSKSTMPIWLNLLYLTAHFASKLLIVFKSLFVQIWSRPSLGMILRPNRTLHGLDSCYSALTTVLYTCIWVSKHPTCSIA